MANFVSVLANVGHLFKVGWERAAAFEANPKVQAAEQGAVAVISVIDPPLGASIMAFFGIFIKVEQMSTALGAPKGNGLLKLQASLPEFEQMILALPIFKGKEIPDPEKFNKALIQAASGLVDIMNSFKSAAPVPVETVPPISVPVPAVNA